MPTGAILPIRVSASGANSKDNSSAVGIPARGFVRSVTATFTEGTLIAGQYYARIWLLNSDTVGPGAVIATLWSGYLDDAVASSFPNLRVENGMTLYAELYVGSLAAAGDTVIFNVDVGDEPLGTTTIHNEPAFQGRGCPVSMSITGPVAGSDYPAQNVPSYARWRLLAFDGTLTTSSVSASRRPTIARQNSAGDNYARDGAAGVIGASHTVEVSWGLGLPDIYNNENVDLLQNSSGLSDIVQRSGDKIVSETQNLQSGDAWGNAVYVVEEWVGPLA